MINKIDSVVFPYKLKILAWSIINISNKFFFEDGKRYVIKEFLIHDFVSVCCVCNFFLIKLIGQFFHKSQSEARRTEAFEFFKFNYYELICNKNYHF